MFLLLTRGKIALSLSLCLALFLYLSEPLIIPYIVVEAPLGSIISNLALNRAVAVGGCGDLVLSNGLISKNIDVVREACLIANQKKSISSVPLLFKISSISDPETASLARTALRSIIGKSKLSKDLSTAGRERLLALLRESRGKGFNGRIASQKLTDYGIVAVEPITDRLEAIVNNKNHGEEIVPLMDTLGNIGSGYRPELIIAFLQKPLAKPLRTSAEVALARLGTAVLPFLDKELKSKDYWRFASAIEVLYAVDKDLAVYYLSNLLVSGYGFSESIRAKSYEIFGRAGKVVAQEALRQGILFEASPHMQIQAIQAIAKIKDESVVPILLKAMVQNPNHKVREEASKALYMNGTPRAHMALTESYLSGPANSPRNKPIGDVLRGNATSSGSMR